MKGGICEANAAFSFCTLLVCINFFYMQRGK